LFGWVGYIVVVVVNLLYKTSHFLYVSSIKLGQLPLNFALNLHFVLGVFTLLVSIKSMKITYYSNLDDDAPCPQESSRFTYEMVPDNAVNANDFRDCTPPMEECVGRSNSPTADFEPVVISRNARRRLPIGIHGTIDRTTVHVSRIFKRFRDTRVNILQSSYMTHTDTWRTDVSQTLSDTVRCEAPVADVQIVGTSKNVMRRLSIGNPHVVDITCVPVSRIFQRFKDMPVHRVEPNTKTQTGIRHSIGSRAPLTPLDVSLENNNNGNVQHGYLPAEYPRVQTRTIHNAVSATNKPSTPNAHKPKYLQPVSTLWSKEGSFSRNIKKRSMPSSLQQTLQPNAPTCHADVLCPIDVQTTITAVNHAYLCLDVKSHTIRPEIISFLNDNQENVNHNCASAEHSNDCCMFKHTEVSATIEPLVLHGCKRRWSDSLSTTSSKKNSSSRNVKRRSRSEGSLEQQEIDATQAKYRMKIRLYNKGGVRGYELPTTDTLGAIVFEDGPKSRTDFDVIIEFRGGPPQRISKLHQSYMSLQFPLLFTFGQPGFYPELVLKPRDGRGKGNKYAVTVFCAIEQSRLDYIRKNQANLRSDYLLGLYDVVSRGDREGIEVGSMIMLPSTFIGGPRYMYNHYLDALAICRSLGNPQFFITFTSNVKWPEIKRYMLQYPGLTPSDRADIVCRIFQQKVNDFLRFLKDVRPFGYVIADSKTKIQSATQIDEYISAEIPNPAEDPTGYKVVTELMMHRPCGSANLEWYVYNNENTDDRHLTYLDFPSEFVWYANSKRWHRRVVPWTKKSLACLGDDREWDIALEESAVLATSSEIRTLFAQLLIYCEGGNRKDIPLKTIISTLRSEGKIVLAVASSGIASLLLPAGRTTHSRFKLPLDLTDESVCHAKNSQLVNLLVETNLIIWDEAPMNDRRCFEALDRTLRDLMNEPDLLFGGKTIVLGGDFRQTLPVKKGVAKEELIHACIAESYLWLHFKICTLKTNMRLFKPGLDNEEHKRLEAFAKWLLDIGNGEIGESYEEDDRDTSWITIPSEYCVTPDEKGLSELIDFIYDENTLKKPTAGLAKTYLSKDEATPMGGETSETDMLYPMEYLNTITFPGFPPYELQLKVGSPIMLLRNENSVLEARVYRKWISKSIPDMKYLSFCCILIDIQGNAIQANMDVNNIDYFNPLLKPQMVYRISNFICEKAKPFQQTLENHISLKFGKITSFEMLIGKESEFPKHHFEFTPYNQLSSWVPYRDEDSKMIYPILTEIQLTASPATHYYINPRIQEAEYVHRTLKERYNLNPPLQVSKFRSDNPEEEKKRNRQTLHTLLQENPTSFQGIRYKFKATVADGTATAEFTFFTKGGEKITGSPCSHLMQKYNSTDERQLPTEMVNIIGKRHIFQFHFAPSTQKGAGQFIMDDILDIQPPINSQNTGVVLAASSASTIATKKRR
ncbi:DNA helicase, partial [Tanacetum coccineum]